MPLAFVAYLPAAGLLGKPMPLGLPGVAAWSAPFVALLTALVARAVWGPPSATTGARGADRGNHARSSSRDVAQDLHGPREGRPRAAPQARGARRRRHSTSAIEAGAMVGYIGPNGAGKSTTIKMLTGILVPTSGDVRVDGIDPEP